MSDIRTAVGASTADSITVAGLDLATEVMGHVDFADLAFLLACGRLPGHGESVVFNAILVALADHGLTPSALAARLTLTGAPESIQGAMAAGLLGGGSALLGVVEDTARFLSQALADLDASASDDDLATAAAVALDGVRAAGRRVPGLGHPIHRVEDPRAPRLYLLAAEHGVLGLHLRLLEFVAQASRERTGRTLPINGAGVCGAALADLGFPASIIRGAALLARAGGLLGHLREERERPIGMRLWHSIDGGVVYDAVHPGPRQPGR
jgi:citrate synthase